MAKKVNQEGLRLAAKAEELLAKAAELALDPAQKASLRNAWRLAGGSRREREQANRQIRDVEMALQRRVADVVLTDVLTGGQLRPVGALEAVRVSGRDGLAEMFDAGLIDSRDLDTGFRYRELLELAGCGLRSQLDDRPGGGSGTCDGLILAKLDQAKAGVLVSWIETVVVAKSRGDTSRRGMRELKALRLIAGEGRTARSICNGSKPAAAYHAALVRALPNVRLALRTWPGLPLDEGAE